MPFDLTAFVISKEPSGCLSIPAELQSGKAVSYIPHKVSLFVVSSQAGSLLSVERGSSEVTDQRI